MTLQTGTARRSARVDHISENPRIGFSRLDDLLSWQATLSQRLTPAKLLSDMSWRSWSVFEQAHALPPEASPDAQTLVHALIQTQAALRKTTHQATRQWFSEALQKGEQVQGEALPPDALTSRTLEAISELRRLSPSHSCSGSDGWTN